MRKTVLQNIKYGISYVPVRVRIPGTADFQCERTWKKFVRNTLHVLGYHWFRKKGNGGTDPDTVCKIIHGFTCECNSKIMIFSNIMWKQHRREALLRHLMFHPFFVLQILRLPIRFQSCLLFLYNTVQKGGEDLLRIFHLHHLLRKCRAFYFRL